MLTDSVSNNGWNRQVHAKLLPHFKICLCLIDDPFFEFANSHLSSLKKYSFFAKMGTSIDIRLDREGAFYQSVYNAHVKMSLSILCVLCLFFLYVVVVIEFTTLRFRHNGHDDVSNHQPHHCLLNRLFGCRSKKTSKLVYTTTILLKVLQMFSDRPKVHIAQHLLSAILT